MAQEPAVGHHNPWKRRTKDDVVRGAPKGRTFQKRRRKQPKFNNGIRDRGLKQQLRLGSKENFKEALERTIVFKIVKLAAGSSVRIKKMSVKTLWRSRPPSKRKKRLPTTGVLAMQEYRPLSEVLPAPSGERRNGGTP
jgi:hypothetical protein